MFARCSVFEKEAFATVQAVSRIEYLTPCSLTNIYIDHRNLIFIFDPLSKATANHAREILLRNLRFWIRYESFNESFGKVS